MGRPKLIFWHYVEPEPTSGCWLWSGSVNRLGYGTLGDQGLAHRIGYRLLVGPIPAGLEIDHLCRVRSCVNPAHLEPVPHRVNVLRGDADAARNARKTHCPQGHAYTIENMLVRTRLAGKRVCRICDKAATARYRRRVALRL